MTTKDEVRSTVEALKMALKLALEALEETRNALAWFYDSYPQDVTKKGNELLPHVETVLTAIREALASKSEALMSVPDGAQSRSDEEQPAPVAEPHKQQSAERGEPWRGLTEVEVWNTYKYLWMFHPTEEPRLAGDILKFARAIEAKLKEKNNG